MLSSFKDAAGSWVYKYTHISLIIWSQKIQIQMSDLTFNLDSMLLKTW